MLSCVECVFGDAPPEHVARRCASLRAAFPTLSVGVVSQPSRDAFPVDIGEWWSSSLSFWDFDGRVDAAMEAGATTLALLAQGAESPGALEAVVTRCQRWIGRRNRHSAEPKFDDALRAHRALYDLRKPLLLADYRHALDTWQWTLRLNGEASAPLQIAALLHDIERIDAEAEKRIEHLAPNYENFKTVHARRGADGARRFLRGIAIPGVSAERVVHLVARHEAPAGDEELALLNDADSLSFFSLNSAGFIDYYGQAHTARKIRYTLARMSEGARIALADLRLRADVARLLGQATRTENPLPIASAP